MVHQTMRLATFFFRCRGFVLCVKLALAGVGHELLAFLVKGTKGKTTVNYDRYQTNQACKHVQHLHTVPVESCFEPLQRLLGCHAVRNIAGSISNRSGYACQMASLIEDWRSIWSAVPNTTDPLFPFGVTQLAGSCSEGSPANSAPFRRAQTGGWGHLPNADMKNTFLGQAFDLGDP
jgi:hypothetical protein